MVPEAELWKIFVSLGVPGLALGILYFLSRKVTVIPPALPRRWLGPVVILVTMLFSGLIFTALVLWAPGGDRSSVSIGRQSEVAGTVGGRDVLKGSPPRDIEVGKKDEPSPSESTVEIGGGAVVSGTVAGRDVVLAFDPVQGRVEELVAILEHRYARIVQQLSPYYNYVAVREYLEEFARLHALPILRLKAGQVSAAHEILGQIHELSFRLEQDEFWERHRIETPNARYSLRRDAFQRGPLVCGYIADQIQSYCDGYPITVGFARREENSPLTTVELYKMILESG